jgi:hypothetical protein
MPIPEGEDFCVPHILNDFVIDGTSVFVLQMLPLLLSPLNQDSSKIVNPFCPLLGRPSFQVQSSLSGGNGKA